MGELSLFTLDLLAFLAVYMLVVVSLNLEYGYTGIPNFGKVLAVSAGAFTAPIPGRILTEVHGLSRGIQAYQDHEILATCMREVTFRVPEILERGVYYPKDSAIASTCLNKVLATDPILSLSIAIFTILVAAAVGAGLGYLSAYPAIRLREDYLAMTLLAMGEAVFVLGTNFDPIVGGKRGGMSVPDVFRWVGGENRFVLATFVVLVFAVLAYLYMERLSKSPIARVMKAVRDKELAAEVLGKDVVKIRQNILIVSSAIAAVAGALWGMYLGDVVPTGYNRVTWTFWPWVMVIIGGAANNLGVLLGTSIFVASRKIIDFYKGSIQFLLPFDVVWLDRMALGIVLIAMLIVRPEGILPERPKFTLDRRRIFGILQRTLESPKSQ